MVLFQYLEGHDTRIPAHWTSLIPPDSYVLVSEGRSLFHPRDLLELVQLVKDLKKSGRQSSQKKRKAGM